MKINDRVKVKLYGSVHTGVLVSDLYIAPSGVRHYNVKVGDDIYAMPYCEVFSCDTPDEQMKLSFIDEYQYL